MELKSTYCQHAIKNIGRKILNLNDITFNKRLGSMIGRSFEMPYVSYCPNVVYNSWAGAINARYLNQ
jgi:hypothetical protein